METSGGILSRLGERVLGWIALCVLILVGIAIYQMPADTKQAIWSGIWRTGAWLIFAAAAPWSTRLFIRRIVEARTNWAGVSLVAAVSVADLLAGVLLMTAWPAGVWSWAAALGALALATTYNYLVSDYLADTCGS